jgi:hypothetical protein
VVVLRRPLISQGRFRARLDEDGTPQSLHTLLQYRLHRAANQVHAETVSNALERRVVEGEYEVTLARKELLLVVRRMNRVHSFQAVQPRGSVDFESRVGPKTTRSQRMPVHGFVVGWTKHVSGRTLEAEDRNGQIGRVRSDHAHGRPVP